MQVEQEDEGRVPTTVLYGIGAFMIIVGLVLASTFVFRLQPALQGTPTQSTSAAAGTTSITMPSGVGNNNALNFSPANVTVVVGINNTIVWTNLDSVSHTVVSKQVPAGASSFSSPIIAAGQKFNVTLTVPGTYLYFCSLHPDWMQARITVLGAAQPSQTGLTVSIPSGVGSSNNLNFAPPTITVVIGVNNTVTWVNNDGVKHTVTATDQSFNSGDIQPGKSWTYTFTTAGTFHYLCVYHGWMMGTVVVEQSS